MKEKYSRQITFESIQNFRDIGGYRTRNGFTVAWRRLFRCGDLRHMTPGDFHKLKEEFRLATVIDLRSDFEIKHQGVGLLARADIKYHNISFIADGGDREANERRYKKFTNMGEFYLDLLQDKEFGQRIIEALKVIAEPENQPLIFHCAIGKDRTGILAAITLSLLGVEDADIIEDYSLSGPYMVELLKRINSDPKAAEAAKPLPDYFWKASPESMALFLSTLRRKYGSIRGYLESAGCEPSLLGQLESALLT